MTALWGHRVATAASCCSHRVASPRQLKAFSDPQGPAELRRKLQEATVRAAGLELQGRSFRVRAEKAEAAIATTEAARSACEAENLRLLTEIQLLKDQLREEKQLQERGGARPSPRRAAVPPVPSFASRPVPPVPVPVDTAKLLRQQLLPPGRPEDSCTIFDPEEASLTFVPQWSENYLQAVERQADLDPDTIFGSRVPACKLEDIFSIEMFREVGQPPSKKIKRDSGSGDWEAADILTREEILDYKRKMGQIRSWKVAPSSAFR
mmetsp:Transcript_22460/g.40073  ORF Transcript_22460/g.40073 Transcript_22460/m.40073 type:complete len:265 (+) Transcript_22460:44-838(+)